jgi:two-component system OmpR family sensor kinase
MVRTVRIRLTFWYVGVLAAVLVTFSLGVYSVLGKSLRQRLDGNLRSATQVAALALNHEIEEHHGKQDGEANVRLVLNTMHQTSFPRPNIAIWDAGRLVAEKPGIAGLPAPVAGLRTTADGRHGTSFETIRSNGTAYRMITWDVMVPSIGVEYRVISNESLQPVQAELKALTEAFLISVPICLLAAAAGGYFLARKSLHPVIEMTRTAQQISSRNLDQRLTVTNPDDELGFLAVTFNRMFERLQESFRQQRQFMTDASHELRTPVSIALTATQVSLKNRSHTVEDLRETLEVVEWQMLRLRRVVEDMFTLAQADTGAVEPGRDRFYLDEVLLESVRAARVLGDARGVQIGVAHLAPEALYEGDEGLIRQLFLILLDNAVKFTPSGGQVRVSLLAGEQSYDVRVADTGHGILPSDQPHIFDRFYRADKSRSRREPGGGAGLGLAIAKWIADLHRGTVRLEKSDEHGSVFRVEVPSENRRYTVGPLDQQMHSQHQA